MASFDDRNFNQSNQNHQINQDQSNTIYISRICQVLGFNEDCEDFRSIAKNLLTEGRQTLQQYHTNISSSIFQEQSTDEGCPQLLQILKEYFEEQWQKMSFDWFKTFLNEQKNNRDGSEEYQRVLIRTAEYGSKFTKECPVFSIVLQLVYEFDDDTIMVDDFFDNLWKSFIMNGLKSALTLSAEHIVPETKNKHMNDSESPLRLALRELFRQPLTILLQKCKILKQKNLETALDCLADEGWKLGLKNTKFVNLIKPVQYDLLLQALENYLNEQNLNQYVDSSSSLPPTSTQDFLLPKSVINSNLSQSSELINITLQNNRTTIQPQSSSLKSISEFSESYNSDILRSSQSSSNILLTEVECTMINDYVKSIKQFSLSTFMQEGEFVYIKKVWDGVACEIVKEFFVSKKFFKFLQDSLRVVIYLLKRHQNLNEFFEYLSFHYSKIFGSSRNNYIQISIRLIIHVLLLSSNASVSQMVMTLLSKRNPVPFLEPSIDERLYSFVSDITSVWDCSIPTILSFGIGPCSGKSTLLNALFMSSFGQTIESIYFQQTIDIDFGYHFLPRRSIHIADTHGQMNKPLLNMIYHLFDGFIIQINGTFYNNNNNNIAYIKDMLEVIPKTKYSIIILRDVNEQLRSTYPESLKITRLSHFWEIPITTLPNVSATVDNYSRIQIKLLRNRILDEVPRECSYTRDELHDKIQHLVEPKTKFDMKEIMKTIDLLKDKLKQTISDNNILIEYFPVYTKFVELCRQRQEIAKTSTTEEIYTHRQNIYKLEKEIDSIVRKEVGQIFHQFIDILQSNQTLTITHILAQHLQYERNQLINKCGITEEMNVVKYLSLEVLWRNIIVCYPYQENNMKQLIHNKYAEYLKAGYPFEIIDGDNFNFPFEFLHQALTDFRDKNILVISIIGPQNSGKSTLLNYMFGTLFDVRDGRCTRGIYGCFVKSNFRDFDYILLIDTEGLGDIEREEKEFGRRLVLFCLAVSHLVMINMVGQINDTLKDMLTLCADSLKKIGVSKVPQPQIHFILNQRTDLNIESNRTAIEKIRADIIKYELNQMIDVSKDNFHALPSAFRKDYASNDTRLPYAIHTEPNFLDHVQNLYSNIIESGIKSFRRSQEYFHDPIQWLNFAITIFDTIQKFSDLTYFRDVNERRQDSEIRTNIKKKLSEVFSTEYKKQLIKETINCTEDDIRNTLNVKELKITDNLQQDLENEFKMLKATDIIRDRSRQFLKAQITAMFSALRSSAIMTAEHQKIIQLVQDGQGELKRLIEETIVNGTSTTEIIAKEKFESMFNNIVQSIQEKSKPFDYLKQAFNFIYTNYNIYENDCLPDRQGLISDHFQWLLDLNNISISIDNDKSVIQERCISYTYKQSSYVEEQFFNPDISSPYTTDIINNLIYLNKNILHQDFNEYCNNHIIELEKSQRSIGDSHTGSQLSLVQRVIGVVSNQFGFSKTRIDHNIPTYEFQKNIRLKIKELESIDVIPNNPEGDWSVLQIVKCFQHLTDDTMNIIKDQQIDTEIIKSIVSSVHTLIKNINLELQPFNLILSRHIKSIFHSYVLLLLTKFYCNEQELYFKQTLQKLTNNKEELLNYFLSMVVPDISYDYDFALNLTKQLKEHIQQQLINDAQEIINNEMKTINYINRRWIQERCDDCMLNTVDNAWVHDYISSPNKVIENYFISTWETVHKQINQLLIDRRNDHINILTDFFRCIKWILHAIKREGAATTFVDSIFQSNPGMTLSVNENLKNKKRCMAKILYTYLSGKSIPNTISVYEITYKFQSKGFDIFDRLAKHSTPSTHLIEITERMSENYDNLSIGNLTVFLEAILNENNQIINYFNELSTDFNTFDKEDTYQKLLTKVCGCQKTCPCCGRPCDIDHTSVQSVPGSINNQHACTLGHALRAMNGYRYEITDEPALVMCELIENDQIIVVGYIRKRWSEFKKDHPDWHFDSIMTNDQRNRLHGKFLGVWTRIGPEICEKYGMKFVTNSTTKPMVPLAFHYILLLDGSGSMKGKPWSDLLNGVKEFLKYRSQKKAGDLISIIVFSTETSVVFFHETINNIDLSKIKYPGKDTNFIAAFTTVYNVIKRTTTLKYNVAFDSMNNSQGYHAIIFMSDGQGVYPRKELEALKAEYKDKIKRFWTVALGQKQMNVLKQINETMGGFFQGITNSNDLLETYAEIARTNIS